MRKKYKVGDIHDRSWMTPKSYWSSLWRGVVRDLKEVIVPGHSWVAGDGENINFWMDSWVSDQPLINFASGDFLEDTKSWLVKDVWRNSVG